MSENTAPVHEFGNGLMLSYGASEDVENVAKDMANREAEKLLDDLKWIKDLQVVQEPEIVFVNSDMLNRFRMIGWRFKVASEGYEHLKKHFACRVRHVPQEITLEFINQMIQEYAQQQREKNNEDDY